MSENIIKNCKVILEPCTPKIKQCYVALQQCKIFPGNEGVLKNISLAKGIKTEPSTPNVEPALATALRREITEKNILTTKTKSKLISALNELEQANAETSRKYKKEKAMLEVIDSEKAYLNHLEIMINFFKKPLIEKYILSLDEANSVFNKVTMLYNINKELYELMDKTPSNIAQAFIKVAPYLKMYSTYAYEYKMITNFLQAQEYKNEEFSRFLKSQETRPEVQMKLSSLLIAPIQRIPRYRLLLKKILCYTLETESDYQILKESLQIVEDCAKHIDSLIEERENSERLLIIQKALVDGNPQIIKPGRKLIKEGKVMKMTETVGRIMYLVAMTDVLMFCKIKKELKSKNSLKCAFILPLRKCKFSQNQALRKICISCEKDDIEIFLETAKEFDQWTIALKESHKNSVNNRCTLRKESSSRRPAYKENLSSYNELGISLDKPQRKRKKTTSENVFKESIEANENTEKRTSWLVLSKRKCIREVRQPSSDDSVSDSLYPLRYHYLPKTDMANVDNRNPNVPDITSDNTDDVFVFGRPDNPNRGFNFGFVNFFTYIGDSLRRLFRIN